METWKDIPGFEGSYQVSDLGRIRNAKGRVLIPQLQNSGYLVVHLYVAGVRKVNLVHRLVALVFVPKQKEGDEVNHINKPKTNNAATNLEWMTRLENIRHARDTGLQVYPRKAVIGVHIENGTTVEFNSQLAAEKALSGKASSAVHHCIVGKKRSAYGYTWSRA